MFQGYVVQAATAGGAGVGLGLTVWSVLRFVRWVAEFIAGRLDRRSDGLERREKEIEGRFNARLKHVEQELERTRHAMMLLINEIALINPANTVLQRVAAILGSAVPLAPADPSLDDLSREAERKLEGKK
jgi:hypothetical protein